MISPTPVNKHEWKSYILYKKILSLTLNEMKLNKTLDET